jgi:hypothetical protein
VEGIMSRTTAIIILGIAAALLAGSLFFFFVATIDASWLPVAAILLAVGGTIAVWAGLALRRLAETGPKRVAARITELAEASGQGEVTLAEAVAELGVPHDAAVAGFNLLERQAQCHREYRGEKEVYVFPGLKPSLIKRKCPYCGTEFSVRTPVHRCPHCGGDLRLERE